MPAIKTIASRLRFSLDTHLRARQLGRYRTFRDFLGTVDVVCRVGVNVIVRRFMLVMVYRSSQCLPQSYLVPKLLGHNRSTRALGSVVSHLYIVTDCVAQLRSIRVIFNNLQRISIELQTSMQRLEPCCQPLTITKCGRGTHVI